MKLRGNNAQFKKLPKEITVINAKGKSSTNLKQMPDIKPKEATSVVQQDERTNQHAETEPFEPPLSVDNDNINKEKPKKHTWIYDELFIKKKIVDMSFEKEREEEEGVMTEGDQLSLNKYNSLQEEIGQLKKELARLNGIIANVGNEQQMTAEKQLTKDIRSYKDIIEHCLRESANLTKDILEMKKRLKEIAKGN